MCVASDKENRLDPSSGTDCNNGEVLTTKEVVRKSVVVDEEDVFYDAVTEPIRHHKTEVLGDETAVEITDKITASQNSQPLSLDACGGVVATVMAVDHVKMEPDDGDEQLVSDEGNPSTPLSTTTTTTTEETDSTKVISSPTVVVKEDVSSTPVKCETVEMEDSESMEITSTPLLATSEDNNTPVATPLSVASKRMGDVSVKSSPSTPGLVTDAMLKEENMYKEERKEEEDRDDVRAQALEELNRTGKQERYPVIIYCIFYLKTSNES